MYSVNITNSIVVMMIVIFSICNLLKSLKTYLSYEYYRYRLMFILEGLILFLGQMTSVVYSLLLYSNFKGDDDKDDKSEHQDWKITLTHWIGTAALPILLVFIVKPDCLFE